MRTLKQVLTERRMFKQITLFFDIETLQYNEAKGKERPSFYKNVTYSVAVSWLDGSMVEYEIFPNFKHLFDTIQMVFKDVSKKPLIELIAHNTNKYDNHYLRHDICYYYPTVTVENFWLTTSNEEGNENSLKIKDLTKKQKQGIILEKRIKSSINLEMTFYLNNQKFQVIDNWVKTNSSIAMLGKKMLRLGVVTKEELKTDFDYTKYHKQEDMTEEEARQYALTVFEQLDQDELIYIRNDVILLAKSVYYYADIFKGFDYSKMTFTSNILESYNTNPLTSFQLLNRIGQGKGKMEIKYTNYHFANQNFYDYLKPFYRGGLNFYNQFQMGKIIENVFGIDINSSYPFAMHNFKIPTFLKSYQEYDKQTKVPIVYSDNEFTLFQISKEVFDHEILDRIKSILLRQILVKYYTTNEFMNLNTYTFRMIQNVTGLTFDDITVFSTVTFETAYFGSRDQIEEFYKVKTQGGKKKKLIIESPYDITETDEVNTELFSQEEIDNSKVNLNGLYGIPALRPYFNLFRLDKEEGDYVNVINGHKNAERNIVFSIFVTAVSLWNLLDPLSYLTPQEIDDNLLYCDTDSLYLKEKIRHKLPDHLFHKYHLGKWDVQNDHINKFYVLNHKKYAYEENGKINVKAGGIPNNSFQTEGLSFEEFIDTQFSDGVEIPTLKSIYNAQGTISLYDSITKLEIGSGYFIRSKNDQVDKIRKQIIEEVREHINDFTSDVMYVETVVGTMSLSDIFPLTHEVTQAEPLVFLEIYQDQIRERIEKQMQVQ